jgi:murein DD-endopeptidase MepM/ murein hydrolase activator NlpD
MSPIKVLCSCTLLASGASAIASETDSLEIRFCPASEVRTFPLESQRSVQSLVVQNVAVINRGATKVQLTGIDFELQRDGAVIDTRSLPATDLTRIAASGQALQTSGMIKLVAFQFCGSSLIDEHTTLAGPDLAQDQAILVTQQPFAYKGNRDALLLRAHAVVDGRSVAVTKTLPIRSGPSKTKFRFPLVGTWFAAVGPTPHTAHRWALPEEFAYDIAKLGAGNSSHRGDGRRFEDYYAYGAPVLAAADGVVVAAANDQSEDLDMLRRPDESDDVYGARVQARQATLLAKGTRGIAGNYVVLDHGNGEFSLYAHLQPGSVRVKAGERVLAGTTLAKLGSSGNSTEPHLHFQVCDAPDPLACAGIPVEFLNVKLPYADYQRPLQSGDVLVAN